MTPLVRRGSRLGFDTLTIDSPANRNALSLRLLEEALAVVRESACSDSRGLLVEHAGSAFCSGVDLKERRGLAPGDQSHSLLLAELLRRLWAHPRPVVAFVDGAARGGGLGILACADLVVATETSTFAYSEVRVGVAPALVMALTLATTPSRALMPHLLTGAAFDAATATTLGLVSQVSGRDDWNGVLASLAAGAPGAQATVKRLARGWSGGDGDVDRTLEDMTALSAELFAGSEAREGMAAFAERRPPAWAPDAAALVPEPVSR
jgi:enoyl-CoA hydratase/carnithine racemase